MKKCRFCGFELKEKFLDLGLSPLANSYLTEAQLQTKEPFYPLEAYVCSNCFLVQLEEFESPENIFSDYAYLSSYSDAFLKHAKDYVEMIAARYDFGKNSLVVEIASNDGYLLQYFVEKNIPVLGIEPAKNVALIARQKGIPTETFFFGADAAVRLASENRQADLIIANNVLAHVPDLNDFVKGMKILLKPEGVITVEFPYLMRLMEDALFDTIYHEHFSYFSLLTAEKVFKAHGLTIFDVDEVSTHGGSLRIYACRDESSSNKITDNVHRLEKAERNKGYADIRHYRGFEKKTAKIKNDFLNFLAVEKAKGKSIVGYGAPAKGNTFLNYCGVKSGLMDYTVDRNPYKQGSYLPGSRIRIEAPDKIKETRPDYVLILAWNLKEEIMNQMSYVRQWGGKFVVAIPETKVL